MTNKQPKFTIETIDTNQLKSHPRNYREHPDDQLEHIIQSIKVHGFYRNIVIARDNTILAGHGVVKAAGKMEITEVPVIRLDLDADEPLALKVLTGDNEMSKMAEVDDRALTEILKEIKEFDLDGLIGTGFDEMMLANLVYVTRSQSEIADFNEAAHWVGMPEYDEELDQRILKIIISFRNEDDRTEFENILDFQIPGNAITKTTWWPPKERDDNQSIRFESLNDR